MVRTSDIQQRFEVKPQIFNDVKKWAATWEEASGLRYPWEGDIPGKMPMSPLFKRGLWLGCCQQEVSAWIL